MFVFVYLYTKIFRKELEIVMMLFLKYLIYSFFLFTFKRKATKYWEKNALWIDFKTEITVEIFGYVLIYILVYILFTVFVFFDMMWFHNQRIIFLLYVFISVVMTFIITSIVSAIWFCIAKRRLNKKITQGTATK